ncbi:MAG: cytochrome b [Sphingomonas sp.]
MSERYTKTAIWLHWLVAIGVITNIALAWTWDYVADDQVRPLINTHKAIGVTVLGLAILRLLWRLTHTPPAIPVSYAKWEVVTAHTVHWGLYLIIFAMPLTGWIMDSAYKDAATHPMSYFGLFQWPRLGFIMDLPADSKKWVHDTFGTAHELIAKLVYALVVLHVAGALRHQMRGAKELQRMGIGRG